MSDMRGTLEYQNEKYRFSFSENTLDLYPVGEKKIPLRNIFVDFERGKDIENIELYGENVNGKKVVFEVPELHSSNNGYLTFEVYSVLEYDEYRYCFKDEEKKPLEHENQIRGLQLVGEEVDLFYPPERIFDMQRLETDKEFFKVVIKKTDKMSLGTLTWKNVQVEFWVKCTATVRYSKMPLSGSSEIDIIFSENVSSDFIREIYYAVYQTFRYIMRRNSIVFDEVSLVDVTEDEKYREIGSFHDYRIDMEKEINKKKKTRRLSYEYIGEKFAVLTRKFLEGIIYLDNLPRNIDSINVMGPDRMLFDFVAFEREYANIYPESNTRTQQYLKAKQDTLDVLDDLITQRSGKEKSYIKSFRKRIEKDENDLKTRMLQVIKDCESIMKPFLNYELGEHYDVKDSSGTSPLIEMATRMNMLRNDMAHGNLDIKLDKIHIFGFNILETLLYVMRFKEIEIEDEKIQKGVSNLMGYNI